MGRRGKLLSIDFIVVAVAINICHNNCKNKLSLARSRSRSVYVCVCVSQLLSHKCCSRKAQLHRNLLQSSCYVNTIFGQHLICSHVKKSLCIRGCINSAPEVTYVNLTFYLQTG